MRTVAFFVLFATTMLVAIVFGEPVNYRQNQRVRVSAKQTVETAPAEDDETDGNKEETTQANLKKSQGPFYALRHPSGALLVLPLNQPNSDSTTVESTTSEDDLIVPTDSTGNVNVAPYAPSGWKPFGRLLLLPNEEVVATTTAVPATTAMPTTTAQPTTLPPKKNLSGRLSAKEQSEQEEIAVADNEAEEVTNSNAKNDAEEVETGVPKNPNGKVEAHNSSTEETTDSSTEPAVTEQPSSKLETTSEPDAEAVDIEQQPKPVNNGGQAQPPVAGPGGPAVPPILQANPGAFIVQLPDGSLQRFVFITAPNTNLPPNAIVPVATSPFQQLVQPQAVQAPQTFGYNPIASPRVVTFSSQYQAF